MSSKKRPQNDSVPGHPGESPIGLGGRGGRPPQERPASRSSDSARDRHRAILKNAARLICERGYEGTSIQDIADDCGLTKAGLYHYIKSKEHLLLEIQNYGMDLFEEQALARVIPIEDPVERLRTCMRLHIGLLTQVRPREVTIILHEHDTLTGEAGAQINARKKRYVRFLESSFAEAIRRGAIRRVQPKVAAYAFLGMVNWIYKWFRPDGSITEQELARAMDEILFGGLVTTAPRRSRSAKPARRPRTRPTR